MEIRSETVLNRLSIFPFLSKLFFAKFKRISYFISFFYLTVLVKLKPKVLKIKSVSADQFNELIHQKKFDFAGDINSCALLSINTLIALSVSNKSWLKLGKCSDGKTEAGESKTEKVEDACWKITMPPVGKNVIINNENYLIQCIALSNDLKDFVLYVTDVKLFNIFSYWNDNHTYSHVECKVQFEGAENNFQPKIAKSVTVAGIHSENDFTIVDYEDILNEYFVKPKYLKIDEIFCVNLKKHAKHLLSKAAYYNVKDVYFKVIAFRKDSDIQEYYVVKDGTYLYLNPAIHSYLPPRKTYFIKTDKDLPGFDVSSCVGGLEKYYDQLKKMCKPFLKSSNIQQKSLFLLSGIKGSGKKITVKSVAAFYGLNLLQINCFDLYGLNPSVVQGKFEQLFSKARRTVPCLIYLKNVELLGREQNYHENARLIDIFQTQIQELWLRKPNSYPLIIIGSTQLKASELVPSIARLFIYKISFESLNIEETTRAIKWLIKSSNMSCNLVDINYIAEKVKGYVFGDLALLVKHAIRFHAIENNNDKKCDHALLRKHFDKGIDVMEAAYSDSIGAARVPTVRWEDVGGLEDLKEEIMLTLNLPLKHPELFASGLKRSGILFYGPPGTGKTLMAKAVATECNYNFLSVKGPELMNMYVGQSEKNVREVFERAREAAPCIIFFDELDSLAPSRGKSGDSGGVTDRVVSQLLAEMDGLDKNKDVFVIAATNRPDLVDPALLRPGRFDKMFYVGVCRDVKSKISVLKALTRRFSLAADVNFEEILKRLPMQVTGADLYSLCSNAWFSAARKAVNLIEKGSEVSLPLEVSSKDFSSAVHQFVPSLSLDDIKYYEKLKSSEDNKRINSF